MSMGIGTNAQHPDEAELTRKLDAVACVVWFTSNGATIPKMIKYQDEEGFVHSITHIHVQNREEKFYCGIPIYEFRCNTVVKNREYLFRLYYYPQTHCWKISWEQ